MGGSQGGRGRALWEGREKVQSTAGGRSRCPSVGLSRTTDNAEISPGHCGNTMGGKRKGDGREEKTGWKDGWTEGWTGGPTGACTGGCMHGQMEGRKETPDTSWRGTVTLGKRKRDSPRSRRREEGRRPPPGENIRLTLTPPLASASRSYGALRPPDPKRRPTDPGDPPRLEDVMLALWALRRPRWVASR